MVYRRVVVVGGSALIALVAGVWLVERSLDVKLAAVAAVHPVGSAGGGRPPGPRHVLREDSAFVSYTLSRRA